MPGVFRYLLILLLLAVVGSGAYAQVRPVYDRGATGLAQMLKKLSTSASVLMVGAHPDDEDTALLAYLARGENARTAYLSLTRGDGGQNIIGPELGEALGVIRTEELIQARRLDGAEQFFGRAYDYGFSKTLAEAKGKWDEQVVLCDTVRVIRTFRPLVVVAQFSGTPADGHGQHQFAGYITPLAVRAAADGSKCGDAGPAWSVLKLYTRQRGQGEPTLRVNTGRYDRLLGRTYFEIAMEARSQHRSQEQGVLELRGDQTSSLKLTGSDAAERTIFDGIDLRAATIAPMLGVDAERLAEMRAAAESAMRELDVKEPKAIIGHLARGYKAAAAIERAATSDATRAMFRAARRLFAEAMLTTYGVQIDALADRETVAAGESFFVGIKAFAGADGARVSNIRLAAPEGWSVTNAETPRTQSPAFVPRESAESAAYFNVAVRADWRPTQPYWLMEPREGDLFRWSGDAAAHTLPVQPSQPRVSAVVEIGGTEIEVERSVEYRFADDIRGEIRRNLNVVPALTLSVDQPMLIVPQSDKEQRRQLSVSVTNNSARPITGVVGVNIPAAPEWKFRNSPATINLKTTGEKASFSSELTVPAKTKPGLYNIYPSVAVGEGLATQTVRTVAYPHIQTHRFYSRAAGDVRVIDLKISAVRVGYVMGSGDRGVDAIKQMGFAVEIISESELASGDLGRFDVIVVGIRAYQVRPDVVANNTRLLDYARGGGTLIVQYQLPGYAQQNLMPFPAQMGPRVADENAPVKVLVPAHPIFNFPNKITDADFAGWVQERNLYNFNNFAPEYTGLLESHDTGEAENSGGLVIAKLGKGNYVYCSYSMFRQLPAGVPGAYRLFANLLSLPRAK